MSAGAGVGMSGARAGADTAEGGGGGRFSGLTCVAVASPNPESANAAGDSGAGQAPEVIPKLPRGRSIRLSGREIIRILMFGTMLVALVVLQKPCADGVAHFVGAFAPPPDAGPPPLPKGTRMDLRRLSDDEIRHYFPTTADAGPAHAPVPAQAPAPATSPTPAPAAPSPNTPAPAR